jgi:hypothetical protein
MSNQKKDEELEEDFRETKYPHLRLASGFKDGDGETPIDNWLLALEPGDIFLVSIKPTAAGSSNHPQELLQKCIMHCKFDNAVLLFYDDYRGSGWMWVRPDVYIKKFDLIMILPTEGPDDNGR